MATIKDLLSAMISKINKAPKTVNGVEPDENGNIEVVSGASSWNDLPDKPFYYEKTNNLFTFREYDGDTRFMCRIEGLNYNHKYTIEVRGDKFEDLSPVFYDGYYNFYYWGSYNTGTSEQQGNTPIGITAQYIKGNGWNDETGEFDYNATDYWQIYVDYNAEVYPDLKPEEINIYRTERKLIDTKCLPEHLQFGENLIPISFRSDTPTSAEGIGWDNWLQCELFISTPNLNVNDSLVIDIRGHIYNGLESALSSSYFPQRVWGANFGDNGHTDDLPFSFWAHATNGWDEDGNHEHQYSMTFAYDSIKYPDLDVGTEVKIYISKIKTLDTEYLPEHLQFGESLETILNKTTVNISSNGDYVTTTTVAVVSGGSYHVTWNNDQYTLEPIENNGALFLGNIAMAGAPVDTGEPFCIIYMEQNGEKQLIILAQPGSTSVVSISGIVFKTIDPKYLPYGNAEEVYF